MPVFIDPWGSALVEDYHRLIEEFGLEPFTDVFPEPNRYMRRGIVFAGRDLQIIADAIRKKGGYYVLSGIMPTGEKIHLGNRITVENIRYFQEQGAETYILVADLESAAARGITLGEARKRALDFHIPAYIALGLDIKNTTFYFQSENRDVMHLAYEFSRRITLSEFTAIYGNADPARIISALTQAADILFPQLKESMPGIIPVGIDQDPHIRLTRDIVRRTKNRRFVLPSSIYHKFTPSLDGELKMSKSKPETCIELPEPINGAKKKLKNALTGGRESIEEQRKTGGVPEKCMVFEMYKQHLIDDDSELKDIYERCRAGELLCGEDKNLACEKLEKFFNDFEKKMESARKKIDKLRFITFV